MRDAEAAELEALKMLEAAREREQRARADGDANALKAAEAAVAAATTLAGERVDASRQRKAAVDKVREEYAKQKAQGGRAFGGPQTSCG